jgi:hypothetical protein
MTIDGRMESEHIVGYHTSSAFLGVPSGSRLIGNCSETPLFVSTNGHLELTSVCSSTFKDFIAHRYTLLVGIDAKEVYLGIVEDYKIAVVIDRSLLLSRGTVLGAWFLV